MVASSSSPSPQEENDYTQKETVESRQSEEEEYIARLESRNTGGIPPAKTMTVTTLIVNDGEASEATEVQLKTTFQSNNVSPPISPFKDNSSRRQEYATSPRPNSASCQRRGRFLIWPAVPTATTTGRL